MNAAVFLDRDGVINRAFVRGGKPYPPSTIGEFEILPGVEQAATALHNAGFLIVVVTNQPDVATGIQRREVVDEMHDQLLKYGLCDVIKVCFHVDSAKCLCRKPKAGMLIEAAHDWKIDFKRSFMVGDRWSDVAAGQTVGCRCFFIDYGYQEQQPDLPFTRVESLVEAAFVICNTNMDR